MRTIRLVTLLLAMTAGYFGLARTPPSAHPSEAARILTHIDLDSFANSTGPRRRPTAHTPADYGFTKLETFPDGWVQVSEPDGGWHIAALLLDTGRTTATICFTDSAGSGGTYHAIQVLTVMRDRRGHWAAVQIADRPDCKNMPALSPTPASVSGPAPAALLQHLDDFRDSLSASDRARLDRVLPRSADGGIAACDRAERSRASCEAAAYLPALRSTGLTARFRATPGPVASGL